MSEYARIKQWRIGKGKVVSGEEVTERVVEIIITAIKAKKEVYQRLVKQGKEATIRKLWKILTNEEPQRKDVGRTLAHLNLRLTYYGYEQRGQTEKEELAMEREMMEGAMRDA